MAVVSMLAACSTSPYVASINAFSTGTDSLVSAHDLMLAGERDDNARFLTALTYTNAPRLTISAGCANPGNCVMDVDPNYRLRNVGARLPLPPRASIVIPPASPPSPLQADPPKPAEAGAKPVRDACLDGPAEPGARQAGAPVAIKNKVTEAEILTALQDYAKALKAVSNATDTAAFNTASTTLATSLGKLGLLAGPFGAAVGPAVKIVTAGISLVLEERRYEALRDGLLTACPAIRVLARAVGQNMADSRERRITTNFEVLSAATPNALSDTLARSEVMRLALGAQIAQNSLSTDPKVVAAKFAKSHDELVVAVRDRQGQDLIVLTDIQTLADAATALKTSLSGAAPGSSAGNAKQP